MKANKDKGTAEFEIKILKPYLQKIDNFGYGEYHIELCDGSIYKLRYFDNTKFQSFMAEEAYKYFK